MNNQVDHAKVKELLDKASEVLIVTHERPGFDSIGSSLALYLGLTGLGKRVTVACPDPVTVELSGFVGANKMTNDLTKKNFIISLDYVDGSIEKVSYNIEGNKFNLVIEPRPGFEPYTKEKVNYSYAGTNADVILAVDTIHLGGLGKLYEDNKDLFATKPVVNVDWHPNNSHYGQVNVVNHSASSTAELVAELLSALGVALTPDIATNLLNAVYGATENFSSAGVSARAFELAAVCTKAGGKRFARGIGREMVGQQPLQQATQPRSGEPSAEQVAPLVPGPGPQQAPDVPSGQALPSSGQAPADWLKPKIFKSSSNLV